ncbi:MAG: class I adenylate-forming enzyme family protein [Geminicoccaceae bacterium]
MVCLSELFFDRLASYPGDPVIEDEDEWLTAGQLLALARDHAAELQAIPVAPGEPVLLACSNRARDIAGFLAIWASGAVAVPVHRNAAEATLTRLRNITRARVTLNLSPERSTLLPDNQVSIQGDPPPCRPMLGEAAVVVFTSGSTGHPKGVVIGHDRLAAKLTAIDQELRFDSQTKTFLVLQLTFIFGQWVSFLTLLNGGRLIMRDRFRPSVVLDDLNNHEITRFAAVPTMLRALLAEQEGRPAIGGEILSGGEVLSTTVECDIRRFWPEAKLWDLYGSTEMSACDFIVRPDDFPRATGTIGRPMAGIDYRLDPKSQELEIRSPYGMLGYLDQPNLTAKAIRGDWFRTGDQAEERRDGLVTLTGRLNDLINRGGNKIFPSEIERMTEACPGVRSAIAAGVPDASKGEAIHLLVVPSDSAQISKNVVHAWLAERLERFKRPDQIHIDDKLPVGDTGKADRRVFRDMIQAGRATADE